MIALAGGMVFSGLASSGKDLRPTPYATAGKSSASVESATATPTAEQQPLSTSGMGSV